MACICDVRHSVAADTIPLPVLGYRPDQAKRPTPLMVLMCCHEDGLKLRTQAAALRRI
jgi:hypothetical protein